VIGMNWKAIDVSTGSRTQLVDITTRIASELSKTGMKNGTCHMYMPHTTAGLTINENADPDVARDILSGLARLVPVTGEYRHAEGNSDAHLKASLVGFSLTWRSEPGRDSTSASSTVPGTGTCWSEPRESRSHAIRPFRGGMRSCPRRGGRDQETLNCTMG